MNLLPRLNFKQWQISTQIQCNGNECCTRWRGCYNIYKEWCGCGGGDNGVCGVRWSWSQSTNGLLSCGDRVAIVTLQWSMEGGYIIHHTFTWLSSEQYSYFDILYWEEKYIILSKTKTYVNALLCAIKSFLDVIWRTEKFGWNLSIPLREAFIKKNHFLIDIRQ